MHTLPLFLCPPERLTAGEIVLEGAEGHHAAAVRRIRPGEQIELADGAGGWARCTVCDVTRSTVRCRVDQRGSEPVPQPHLVVVQALVKGDRSLAAVEAMTETGVDEIVPWRADRCVARWEGARGERAWSRWQVAAREAGKQSRRHRLPVVAEPATTAEVAARLAGATLGVVLDAEADRPLIASTAPAHGEIVLVVGPEGGISDAEIAAFADAGAVARRLGPTVLRTATAGAVAAGVLLARTARWA